MQICIVFALIAYGLQGQQLEYAVVNATETNATGSDGGSLITGSTGNYRRTPEGRGRQLAKNAWECSQAEKTPFKRRQVAAVARKSG